MWDEKQFFKDFARENDKVKPDAEFVRNLKTDIFEDVPARRHTSWVKYGAAAAAVLLCITGTFAWNLRGTTQQPGVQMDGALQAGKEDAHEGGTTIITLTTVKECLEDESSVVTDETGNDIDEKTRAELLGMLEEAVSVDEQPDENAEHQEYHCSGSSEFTLVVYENGYFTISETGIFYR